MAEDEIARRDIKGGSGGRRDGATKGQIARAQFSQNSRESRGTGNRAVGGSINRTTRRPHAEGVGDGVGPGSELQGAAGEGDRARTKSAGAIDHDCSATDGSTAGIIIIGGQLQAARTGLRQSRCPSDFVASSDTAEYIGPRGVIHVDRDGRQSTGKGDGAARPIESDAIPGRISRRCQVIGPVSGGSIPDTTSGQVPDQVTDDWGTEREVIHPRKGVRSRLIRLFPSKIQELTGTPTQARQVASLRTNCKHGASSGGLRAWSARTRRGSTKTQRRRGHRRTESTRSARSRRSADIGGADKIGKRVLIDRGRWVPVHDRIVRETQRVNRRSGSVLQYQTEKSLGRARPLGAERASTGGAVIQLPEAARTTGTRIRTIPLLIVIGSGPSKSIYKPALHPRGASNERGHLRHCRADHRLRQRRGRGRCR